MVLGAAVPACLMVLASEAHAHEVVQKAPSDHEPFHAHRDADSGAHCRDGADPAVEREAALPDLRGSGPASPALSVLLPHLPEPPVPRGRAPDLPMIWSRSALPMHALLGRLLN